MVGLDSHKRARLLLVLSASLFLTGLLLLLTDPVTESPIPSEVTGDVVAFIISCIWIVIIGTTRIERDTRRALDGAFALIYAATLLDLIGNFLRLHLPLQVIQQLSMPLGMILATVGLARWIRNQRRNQERLEQQEQRLVTLSITDELSGLFNSRYFFQRIDQEIDRSLRYQRPISLLFMDIDNFKRFNDQHGHVEGDKVIRALGKTIHTLLRSNDIAFRYGGEEFVALLPETPERGGALVGERIRTSFAERVFNPADGSGPLHCTISVGVAQLDPGERPKSFVRRADQALYQAKAKGKNQVFRHSSFES